MRRSVLISMLLIAALLSGCKREPNPVLPGAYLNIALEIPAPAMVKASVPAADKENAIHSIKIWVFNSNTHALVTSLELDASHPADDFPQAGSIKRYSLPVSWDFALSKPRPTVDVFVLANAAALGLDQTLWAEKTSAHEISLYDDVNGALFGNGSGAATDLFSPAAKITGVNEDNGLPMSGVAKGLVISGEEPTLSLSSISLERCVSKIRFLFSQVLTTVADPADKETFKVDRIELNGYSVPKQEYVFAESAPAVINDYYSSSILFELPGVATVNSSERPEIYAYGGAGEDGPSYERKIKDALDANEITDAGSYYIRESGKPVSGIIHYTVTKGTGDTATERHEARPFTMPADNFPRNHTWTVYAYYVTNRTLQLTVSVLPWGKSDYDIDFSTSSLMVTGKLKVLDNSVSDISRIGTTDEYNVTLKSNSPAIAYLYVATPKGGKLQVLVNGDADAFDVWFSDEPDKSRETTIDPDKNSGRIDLSIYRKESYQGVTTGKSITLDFVAYTPDGDREIEGASECIDQIFNFILP